MLTYAIRMTLRQSLGLTSKLNLICLYLVWCALAINRELKGSLQQHDIAVAAAT